MKGQLIADVGNEIVAEVKLTVPVIVSRIVRIEQTSRTLFQSVGSVTIAQAMGIGVGQLHGDPSGGLPDQAHLKGMVTGASLGDSLVERTVITIHTR
jgi:hypothetical protein